MELWDLYDKNRHFTGLDHVRGEEIPQGYYHLVVHVWIRNSRGEYLISQRSADRPTFPLMWECVGGSVLKGAIHVGGNPCSVTGRRAHVLPKPLRRVLQGFRFLL